jgi:hypothetical protein
MKILNVFEGVEGVGRYSNENARIVVFGVKGNTITASDLKELVFTGDSDSFDRVLLVGDDPFRYTHDSEFVKFVKAVKKAKKKIDAITDGYFSMDYDVVSLFDYVLINVRFMNANPYYLYPSNVIRELKKRLEGRLSFGFIIPKVCDESAIMMFIEDKKIKDNDVYLMPNARDAKKLMYAYADVRRVEKELLKMKHVNVLLSDRHDLERGYQLLPFFRGI